MDKSDFVQKLSLEDQEMYRKYTLESNSSQDMDKSGIVQKLLSQKSRNVQELHSRVQQFERYGQEWFKRYCLENQEMYKNYTLESNSSPDMDKEWYR